MERLSSLLVALALGLGAGACGGGGEAGDGGDGDTGTETGDGDGDGDLEEVAGCDDVVLLAADPDPAQMGPWPVGTRTVALADLTVEVVYPAMPGSEQGLDPHRYDLRPHLPEAEQDKIPDADNPWQACDCYRDLPLDEAHGPYPVIVFIHGTAGFRTQSLTQMVHWASRGFVVVSADHPGIDLAYVMENLLPAGDQEGDANAMLDALESPDADAAFLAGHLDLERVGVAGHSAGGNATAAVAARPKVQVAVPLAAGDEVQPGPDLVATLVMGGMDDNIVNYPGQQMQYEAAAAEKRLVGLSKAGHLAFSDLCVIGADQGGILQIAEDHGVDVNPLLISLGSDGCDEDSLAPETGWAIIDHATAGVFEQVLHCREGMSATVSDIASQYPDVGEYLESL